MMVYFTSAEKKWAHECCSSKLTSDLVLFYVRFVPKETLYFFK